MTSGGTRRYYSNLSSQARGNRRNAKQSTGPKSPAGKKRSRANAIRHGILTSVALVKDGNGIEDAEQFEEMVLSLQHELAPVGELENLLVEKFALCCWRFRRALAFEVDKEKVVSDIRTGRGK
ncbi:MAG TPA: hypothetical protein VMT53_26580 [Terriglobales bacterium]|nr:hypothetical protein [Terriglobales bacterium]